MFDPTVWSYAWVTLLAAALFGYLVGSISFGLVLTRAAGLGDIRRIGSGNIGATNVLRTGNKKLAALTLLLDGGKGTVAVLLAQLYGFEAGLIAALGAMLGHVFPVWLRFKGGKGVATALGILLAVAWPVGVAACLTWLATAALFRYSSLAALVALGASPGFAWALGDGRIAELCLLVAALVFHRHRANIQRLLAGEEPKIGASKPVA